MILHNAPAPLHAHTLETLCSALITGQSVVVEGEDFPFALQSPAARSILAWYWKYRDKWTRNVQKEDIEAIVQQLSQAPAPLPAAAPPPAHTRRILYLKTVRINRFKGVHRFGSVDEPPPIVTFDVSKRLTLIEGVNGAGKTSVLGTILWCLTGLVFRPDGPPVSTAQAVPLSVEGLAEGSGEEGTAMTMSPITPLPSSQVLRNLGDKPLPLDSWVELSLVDAEGRDAGTLTRTVKRSRGNVTLTEPDFAAVGLDPLAREIGTRMPAIIPYLPLGDSSELGKAIAALIGIKPLQDLARHAERVLGKLSKDLVRERRDDIKRIDEGFQKSQRRLAELLTSHPAFNPGVPLPEPGAADAELALGALREYFENVRRQTLAEARAILGDGFDANDAAAGHDLLKNVGAAQLQLEDSHFGRLESVRRLASLTQLPEEALAGAESLVRELLLEAEALAELALRPDAAVRLRLYVLVAGWMKEQDDSSARVEHCPLCRAPLCDRIDDVTGRPVSEHLAEELGTGRGGIGKATAPWVKDALTRLCGIHEALRAELSRDLPETPAQLITAAVGEELFEASCFRGTLAVLREVGRQLSGRAVGTLPSFSAPEAPSLPACLGQEATGLSHGLRRAVRAVAFARWCRQHQGECLAALVAIIGNAEDGQDRFADPRPDDTSLSGRLAALARIVKHTSPLSEALECVRAMTEATASRHEHENRITRYGQAAAALQELCGLSGLVEKEVTFLTRTLGESMARWKARLFMPAFAGAPAAVQPQVEADGAICLDAEADSVRAPAQYVSHKSELRATLFAFLLAFWEYLLETRGGLALLLLDDPQEFYDPPNQRRLAGTIPIVAKKAQVITTTFDPDFSRYLLAAAARELGNDAVEHRRLCPPSGTRPYVELGPFEDVVDQKLRAFDDPTNKNDERIARDFIQAYRIFLEQRLHGFFVDVCEVRLPKQPMVADLITALRARVQDGHEPFDGREFNALVADSALTPLSEFLTLLNESHHRSAHRITYEDVRRARDACVRIQRRLADASEAYERWRLRDVAEAPPPLAEAPPVLAFPRIQVRLFEDLAAFTAESAPTELTEADEMFSTDSFSSHGIFVIRSYNFGLAGPIGCRAIVDLSDESVPDHRLVIALHNGKVLARRLFRDEERPGLVTLASVAEDPVRGPRTLTLPAGEVRLLKVIGILLDQTPYHTRSREEAVEIKDANLLLKVQIAYRLRGESALPLARQGQIVLGGRVLTGEDLQEQENALVAISTTDGAAFKRVGQTVPGARHVRSFDPIGGSGISLLARIEDRDEAAFADVALLLSAREVLGVIYEYP